MNKSDTAAQLEALIKELRDYADRGNALAKQHDVVFAILRSESKVANSCADKIEAALRAAPAEPDMVTMQMTLATSVVVMDYLRELGFKATVAAGSTERVSETVTEPTGKP